jgi:hypothetical protein
LATGLATGLGVGAGVPGRDCGWRGVWTCTGPDNASRPTDFAAGAFADIALAGCAAFAAGLATTCFGDFAGLAAIFLATTAFFAGAALEGAFAGAGFAGALRATALAGASFFAADFAGATFFGAALPAAGFFFAGLAAGLLVFLAALATFFAVFFNATSN